MGDEFNAGKYGAVVAIPFIVTNAVTNKTNEDLSFAGGAGTLAVMPYSGSVVGISVRASADLTAGSATFEAHKDGTEFAQNGAISAVLDDTNQDSFASLRPGVMTFAAGDGVGVSYDSTTDMAPTNTNDFDALVFCQLDPN